MTLQADAVPVAKGKKVHPLIEAAAEGRLPDWAVVTPVRMEHLERVAALMRRWATALELPEWEVQRWSAAGLLHDALRDADPKKMRRALPKKLKNLHPSIVHGPAAAVRLREDGVDDEPLLLAIAFHTLGHPELDRMGLSLCAADFLEPGRMRLHKLRKKLRKRMPEKYRKVTRRIFRLRLASHLQANRPISEYTLGLWNRVTHG